MLREQQIVQEWHQRVGHAGPGTPTAGSLDDARRRASFLEEEGIVEYLEAVKNGDVTGIADAIGDALWIILGTADHHGIDIDPIFQEIARSNFTKFDADGNPVPHPTIPGKIGKSERYEEPNLGPLVALQVAEGTL